MIHTVRAVTGHLAALYLNRAPDEDHDTIGAIPESQEDRAPKTLVRHRQSRVLAVARPTAMRMNTFDELSAACRTHHEHVAKIYSLYISPFQKTLLYEHLELSLRDVTLETECQIASAMDQFLSGIRFLHASGSCFTAENDGVRVSLDGTVKIVLDFSFEDNVSTASSTYWLSLCDETFDALKRPVLSYAGRDFFRLPSVGVIPPADHCFLGQSEGPGGLVQVVRQVAAVKLALGT